MTSRALLVAQPTTTVQNLKPLPGTLVDAQTMKDLLLARGFKRDCVRVVPDDRRTVRDVKEELTTLAKQTAKGDLAVFYFTGHGRPLPDAGCDEIDKLDETLVCSDGVIYDDWFAEDFWPATAPGSRWVMVVDACASLTSVLRDESLTMGLVPTVRGPTGPPPQVHRLVMAACADDKSATALPQSGDQPSQGLFTSALRAVLDEQPPTLRYVDLEKLLPERVAQLAGGHGRASEPRFFNDGEDDSLRFSSALAPLSD